MDYLLEIKRLGQIREAKINFSDLTVLVGPQASGKSITLQLLKLLVDVGHIQAEMKKHGLDWSGKLDEFFSAYYGEGMGALWHQGESEITWGKNKIDLSSWAARLRKEKPEKLFYIPAQRVLSMKDGWPRPFSDYRPGDPYTVRDFSEKLRGLVENEFGASETLFPQKNRLNVEYREKLIESLFNQYKLQIDKLGPQKRLVLGGEESGRNLPYMVWSAGQREFVPLLLGFYWLIPPTKVTRRGEIEWVVIEEMEMGLHPAAITAMLLLVLELLKREYKVCISTHSPQILEMVWALRNFRMAGVKEPVLELFDVKKNAPMMKVAESVMKKDMSVYYFNGEDGIVTDISNLDPDSPDISEAEWGGLVNFGNRAMESVARAVSMGENR